MHRLFWKIFLLFWVVNACVFTFGFFIASLHSDRDFNSRFPIQRNASRAIVAFENDELDRFYLRNRGSKSPKQFLLDANNRLLPEGYVSSMPVPVVDEYPWQERVRNGFKVTVTEAVEVVAEGETYRYIVQYNPHRSGGRPPFVFPLFFIAIAATSMFLAAYLTRPLRRLQGVVRRFASGEHDARVTSHLVCRRDVVGEVGREFNVMAERLKSQLESQRRLLRDISHELRTPLARMQVAVAIAEDNCAGAPEPLARLNTEIERLDRLIGQVLALSRIESGAGKLNKEVFSLHDLISSIVKDAEFEFSVDQKRVNQQFADKYKITADKEQLQSAIENVIRNAMRYTSAKGAIDIGVTLMAGEPGTGDAKQLLCLTIRDRGPGVAEGSLAKLFDAFYREDESRDVGSGGHGVGLAITRSIVAAHGGRVGATNHPEGGLVVEMCLPFDS